MIHAKALKRVRFSFDTDTKKFAIVELPRQTSSTGDFQPTVVTYLTVIEACSLVRFVFSMVQYHLPKKGIRTKAKPKTRIRIKPKQ